MAKTGSLQGKPLEIERKFLIEMPDIGWLQKQKNLQTVQIEQFYFDTDTEKKLRIRSWKEIGCIRYILTKKTKLTDMTRIEEEREIREEEFRAVLNGGGKNIRRIRKTRYRFPYGGKLIEVDLFPFWSGQAVAEVELEREEEQIALPPELKVIREVTGDESYTNYGLAEPVGPKL